MPKERVKFCEKCKKNTVHMYRGKGGEGIDTSELVHESYLTVITGGLHLITKAIAGDFDKRSKFWECTKCGNIFEEK